MLITNWWYFFFGSSLVARWLDSRLVFFFSCSFYWDVSTFRKTDFSDGYVAKSVEDDFVNASLRAVNTITIHEHVEKRERNMKNRIAAIKIWILVQKLNIFCHLNKLTICINRIQWTRENDVLLGCEKRWREKKYCYAKLPNYYTRALSKPNHTRWSKKKKEKYSVALLWKQTELTVHKIEFTNLWFNWISKCCQGDRFVSANNEISANGECDQANHLQLLVFSFLTTSNSETCYRFWIPFDTFPLLW